MEVVDEREEARGTAGASAERGFRLKSILFQRTKLTPCPPCPLPFRERARALARTHVRMHARIFVNNIRGNLIIFLLPRFNSERFFRFSSPRAPSPPEHPHPALSLHARSCVRFDVFARGKVRLVGVRSPVGWEMKGRPFSSVCARTYVTHVIMMERVLPQRERERERKRESKGG